MREKRLSSERAPFKEKLTLYYEMIFRGEPKTQSPGFWDEFFLLWANIGRLENELLNMSPEQIIEIKPIIQCVTRQCISTIREDSHMRAVNAIQTLCGLIRGVVKRVSSCVTAYDTVDLLFGFDRAEHSTKALIERLSEFLVEEYPSSLKTLSLHLLLTIVVLVDKLERNALLEFLLVNSVFESVMGVLANGQLRQTHGKDAVLLISLLANFRKHEGVNPYIVKLSILDDELAMNGYSQVIASALSAYNLNFQKQLALSESKGGMLHSLTNMVGSLFVADEQSNLEVNTDEGLLLALYEAIHLNRNFITTLTRPPATDGTCSSESSGEPVKEVAPTPVCPSNLLVSFLTYCSMVTQDLRSERNRNAAKLCMISLTCIVEDQYANSLMHDINMAFRVPLYRAPMRHRRGSFDQDPPLRPLASTVLDLAVEFILSHMMKKNLPLELYLWTLGVIHRILCYERKCRVRLQYSWRDLWNALIVLLRFLVQNETTLFASGVDVFLLSQKIATILNLFITFGDTFLPSPASYDHLYYEIVRQAETFENLYAMVLRYLNCENAQKEGAGRLGNQLVNIRAIIAHLQPKIDLLAINSVTESQVLEVVRSNYDSLSLKLYENLDVFERYNEKPRETNFFSEMIKSTVIAVREDVERTQIIHQTVLDQLSTIK